MTATTDIATESTISAEPLVQCVPAWWAAMYFESFDIPVPRLDRNVTLSPSTLPEESVKGLFRYGARQKLNDAHAPCTAGKYPVESEREAEASKRVDKCRDALLAGTAFRGDRTIDPVAAKHRATARAIEAASPEVQAAIAALLAGNTPPVTVAESVGVAAVEAAVAEIVPPEKVAETKRRNRATK